MIIVYIICASKKEAIKIANRLIDKKLAACVNFWPVDSIYRWRGKKEKAKEIVLLVKTLKSNYKKIERAVLKLHSYKIPCIISWPITKGYSKYLDWVGLKKKLAREIGLGPSTRLLYPPKPRDPERQARDEGA